MRHQLRHVFISFVFISFVLLNIFAAPALAAPGRVPAEPVNDGITAQEYSDQQATLFNRISQIIPAGLQSDEVQVELTAQEQTELESARNHSRGFEPQKIGLVKAIPTSMDFSNLRSGQIFRRGGKVAAGTFAETADGGFVWLAELSSPGADAIRLKINHFSLPDGASLYFYNSSGEVRGPYTQTGPNGNGSFWTNSLSSDRGYLLLHHEGPYSEDSLNAVSLVVGGLGHIGRGHPTPSYQDFSSNQCGNNAACMIDAQCGLPAPAAAAANAVAKMEWIRGPYIYTCTGGLVADTDPNTQRRLFLTANHCLNKSNSNLETFFHYTTSSCNGGCPGTVNPTTTGVTKLASGSSGDFALFELGSGTLPANAVFLGWNNSPVAFIHGLDLYRVSNPNFGPQVYSRHSVDTQAVTCTSWPRGQRIYSQDLSGATDGGSSGSPVVNSAAEIVGQLSGCCGYNCNNVCDSASNSTVDGALASYYSSVASFLDPQSSGGGSCTSSTECDDGIFCNGSETCSNGSCQPGSNPCPGQVCQEATASCSSGGCTLLPLGASCSSNSQCCSNKCRGSAGNKTCR